MHGKPLTSIVTNETLSSGFPASQMKSSTPVTLLKAWVFSLVSIRGGAAHLTGQGSLCRTYLYKAGATLG